MSEYVMNCPKSHDDTVSQYDHSGYDIQETKIKIQIRKPFFDNKAFQAGIIFKSV